MNKQTAIFIFLALAFGTLLGFTIANSINKQEINSLKAEVGELKNSSRQTSENNQQLSDDEIKTKIAEADANPQNIEFQKNLSFALYRYSVLKQKNEWLIDITRMLTRVFEKNPKDLNTIVLLANLYFDIAQKENNQQHYQKSRFYYEKALEINPQDAEIITDYGLTYLLANPPDEKKAITEFEKSLKIQPDSEKTLQGLIQAQITLNNLKDAEENLKKLKIINSSNSAITELTQLLETKRGK